MPNVRKVSPASRVFTGKVLSGNQLGRTIGFPTLNLDPGLVPVDTKPGVYASRVEINGKEYGGALYYGPRLVLDETATVLEIYVLDFSQEIYGKTVHFALEHWVRGVQDFQTFPELQKQLQKDIQDVRQFLQTIPEKK